ncbi:hypothetical protein ACWEQL_13150 [Kitasatospora sp. NPDC004240]
MDTADPQQWKGFAYSENGPVNQSDPTPRSVGNLPRRLSGAPQVRVQTSRCTAG